MMKSICALTRKGGWERSAFHNYYEESHAPLAVRHFPFARYVRNHLVGAVEPGFDTISEFWAEDIEKLAGLMNGPIGELMAADEERFMDRSRISPAGASEVLISGIGSPIPPERCAVLLQWQADEANGRRIATEWAQSLADDDRPISIDFIEPWSEPAFPARAVIWTDCGPVPDPPAILQATCLHVRSMETPAHLLIASKQEG